MEILEHRKEDLQIRKEEKGIRAEHRIKIRMLIRKEAQEEKDPEQLLKVGRADKEKGIRADPETETNLKQFPTLDSRKSMMN